MGFSVFITFFISLMPPLFSVAGGYFHWWVRRQKFHRMPTRKPIEAYNVASSYVSFRTSMAAMVCSFLLISFSRGHVTAFHAAHGSGLPPLLLRFRCACLFAGDTSNFYCIFGGLRVVLAFAQPPRSGPA